MKFRLTYTMHIPGECKTTKSKEIDVKEAMKVYENTTQLIIEEMEMIRKYAKYDGKKIGKVTFDYLTLENDEEVMYLEVNPF